MREKVKWQVNRATPEDKLRDFLKWMVAIKKDTEHHVRGVVWGAPVINDEIVVSCISDLTSQEVVDQDSHYIPVSVT